MEESRWEKYKKIDTLGMITLDEFFVLIIGITIFLYLLSYRAIFMISVILWYWLKIRFYERKIIEKERKIYNIYYENIRPMAQELIDKRTEKDREPMEYDLKQLENKRKFLVDKFVILNLILVVLIELFIKK